MAGLGDWFGQPGVSPEQNEWLKRQMLMSGFAELLKNSAPTTDPRAANSGFQVGSALQAGLGARNTGLAGLLAGEQQQKLMAEREKQKALSQAIGGVPTTEPFPMPENSGYKVSKPRDLSSLMTDYARATAPIDAEQAKSYAATGIALNKPAKEFNIPGDVDSFLAANYPYTTEQDRMKALNEFRKPETKQKFIEWKRSIATPYFSVVPTSEGLVTFNSRTGQPSGQTGYNKPLSPEMITAQQQIGTLNETLDKVKTLYKPDYVGPISGRYGSAKEYTVGLDPKQAAFYSNSEQIKNSLIYLMSGKQINESEYDRLIKQLPDRNLPASVFETRMKEFEGTMDSIIEERRKASGGYGVPKTTLTPSPKSSKKLTFNPKTGVFE